MPAQEPPQLQQQQSQQQSQLQQQNQSQQPQSPQQQPQSVGGVQQPQRSNSLDYLNFEEKRQLIASSLSLTDFINCASQQPAKDVPNQTTVVVGQSLVNRLFSCNGHFFYFFYFIAIFR